MAHKPKILVVENDAPTLRQLETTLKTMGADPRCLGSSKKAAELISKDKFDGAFLDWDTPDLNGEQLTKLIRNSKSNARMPIAMLTERSDTHSIAQGFKVGVTFFLSKPVGAKELTRLLNASRGAMLEERRRYGRIPLQVPVICVWEEKRITGQTQDVSTTGMLVALAPAPPLKTDVSLDFTLPHTRAPISLKGVVVRAGPQVGVKFTKISAEQRDLLKTFVDRQLGLHPAAV